MIIGVKILPRKEVLDTQGRTVQKTLQSHGRSVEQCRVGRYVQLDIPESQKEQALERAREIAEFVLYNPLIESFELEVVSEER